MNLGTVYREAGPLTLLSLLPLLKPSSFCSGRKREAVVQKHMTVSARHSGKCYSRAVVEFAAAGGRSLHFFTSENKCFFDCLTWVSVAKIKETSPLSNSSKLQPLPLCVARYHTLDPEKKV